jgi:NAD(P)-dependent dehydrogenase (short-subunit alcohol dehydrogenase family)
LRDATHQAVGKFGLRALAQSIAREFGPQGIHAAHVIIDGMVDLEGTMKVTNCWR